MKKLHASVELHDGTEIGPVRVTLAHKLQAERTCKARAIPMDTLEAEVIMSWLATRDQDGPLSGLSYDDWTSAVLDSALTADEADAPELDPTPRDR